MNKLPEFTGSVDDSEAVKAFVNKNGYALSVMSMPMNRAAYDTIQSLIDCSYTTGGDLELGTALISISKSIKHTIDTLGAEKSTSAIIGFAVSAMYFGWECERRYREGNGGDDHAHLLDVKGSEK